MAPERCAADISRRRLMRHVVGQTIARQAVSLTLLMRAKETDTHMVVSDLVRAFDTRLRDRQ